MSEQKLISPLLDGFVMGDPMSDHDGVRCCPAMRENSDEKYIVKIISVPASQKQLDALLLTGAYKDAAAAMEYFKDLSDGVVQEAELLRKLSRLEGFLPYDSWQVVPMEDNKLGYEIYLLSPYKRSLEKYLRRNTMTHLGAVNLGLDLCAALAICRRSGHMFVDLKPGNIFLTGEREYRIGDLGFVKLNSLKYTSMPARYRSCYTPPELHNELATLNPTVDIYGVGMVLYQIYNNGVLPFKGKAPNKALPAPMNADYEMAEIILKACAPNPRNRYQTPIEMGQALVAYMQRNTVNDVPIVPPAAEPDVTDYVQPSVSETDETEDLIPADEVATEASEASAPEQPEELSFMEEMVSDETAPDIINGDDVSDLEMSEEVMSMLAQADELANAEVPSAESAAAEIAEEETAETEVPSEETSEPETEDEDELGIRALLQDPPTAEDKEPETEDDDESDFFAGARPRKKKKRGLVTVIVLLLILALLGGGGYYFYQNYYLLPIDNMNISGDEDTITVVLTTNVDQSILTVVCTDSYGNVKQSKLTDGQAVFTDLNPDTQYKITVEAEGFHQLTDSYYGTYSTGKQTTIVDFSAKTGTEDGSVILNFTVDGPETQDWVVEYTTEGEESQSVSFTGHMVSVSGLTVGKTYTFTLTPPPNSNQWVVGNTALEFTASKIVMAENVYIASCSDGVLTAKWSTPDGADVASWTVRCYSDSGYDQTVTVSEASAEFTEIDTSNAYTVEVWAEGMTQSTRAYVTANPTTITDFSVDDSDGKTLKITWNYSGTAPEGGWLLMYSLDGSDKQDVVSCTDASAAIEMRIPKSVYDFTIKASDGSTVFGGVYQYTCPAAAEFEGHSVKASDFEVHFCVTPEKEGWTYKDVDEADYTTNFAVDDKISMILYSTASMTYNSEQTEVMYVIRDAEGNVLPDLVRTETAAWKAIWKNRYCTLNIPAVPGNPGNYTIEVYFNNALALSQEFKITAG